MINLKPHRKKRSEEAKRKTSETLKKFWENYDSTERDKKISIANRGQVSWIKGKHHSEETRRKIGLAHKDKNVSLKTRQLLSIRAKNRTDKHNVAISRGLKLRFLDKKNHPRFGVPVSLETRRKIGLGNKGKKHSEEHRRKIGLKLKGKPLSLETRRKISEAHKGEKAYWWRGGLTPINKQVRGSLEMKLWREAVFKRDNWTCVWCGLKGGWSKEQRKKIEIQADHIKSFSQYPNLRFDINNGRTLCVDCHKKTDTYAGKSHIK